MEAEIEAKFLYVSHDALRGKLKEIGADLVSPMRLLTRVTIDTPEMKSKDAFIRVRDQGDKITITYKQFDELSVDGAKEIEVTTDDFEKTIAIFRESGLPFGSLQESRRETWIYEGATIELDEWPWLEPYVEIEAKNEEQVRGLAAKLGFKWENAVFGDVMAAYRLQYPHLGPKDTVGNLPEVKFDAPLPELFIP